MISGRVAAVTGAARGIGAAIAAGLAAAGHDVAVLDLDAGAAQQQADLLAKEHGIRAVGVAVDIADKASVPHAVAEVTEKLGAIEVLVNNAGVDVIKPFVDSTEEEWERIVSVNLLGTIRMTRSVLDPMIAADWGRVVVIASDAARVGSSGEVVYSGSKGGVVSFAKALAREVAKHGITINAVCPGPTDTALLDQVAAASQKLYDGLARAVPLRRIGQPEDIAPAVAFLASDGAGYITGQTLSVSGGLTMA